MISRRAWKSPKIQQRTDRGDRHGLPVPGGVNNPEQFWDLLCAGRSGIVRVPAQRWDADAYYCDDHTVPGTICSTEGGFLTSWQPDEFDAEFFSISRAKRRRWTRSSDC